MSEFNIRQAIIGLNTDNIDQQKEQGQLTFALNALIESFDGNKVTYQNEQSNSLCVTFPEGAKVIGVYNITQIDRVLYFLSNNEIGYSDRGECKYNKLMSSECFNFSEDYPIHQIVVKQTNCSIQVYWTDAYNSMRYFDFEDLPWREIPDPNNEFKKIKIEGEVDCNKLLVQPNFSIPEPEIISVEEGGSLLTGTYQFVVQYANDKGEGYTQFYNVSNPVSINQTDRLTSDFNIPTSKAIRVKVEGLDNSGIFDYFNLVVLETVNLITTPKLVGTYPISTQSRDILYAGNTNLIDISINDLFQKYQFYDIADGVTQSDSRIIWYGLKTKEEINYQKIWSKVELQWETHRLPYNPFEGYNNPMNTYLYHGYMRDEVYSFEGVFILKNGKETKTFHIPGRLSRPTDREIISNEDTLSVKGNPCDTIIYDKERWKVYNTATKLGFSPEYLSSNKDNCYKGPYEFGEFAYWESEETYPINPDIWGDLSGQPIRHHKFPDSTITHIHDNVDFSSESYQSLEPAIYPIGVKMVIQSLYNALAISDLTEEQKNDIVGFKILRGDRTASAYRSIVAKGYFNNVGYTEYDGIKHYYPNYPYNDLRPDPYFVTEKLTPETGFRPDKSINGFQNNSKSRFTFHSPDTHFTQVSGVDSGYLKLETIEYGKSYGHFVQVLQNAEYKFLTSKVTQAALAIAQVSGLNIATGTFGWPSYTLNNILPAFSAAKDLFTKLANYTNFGWSFNSIGIYNNYEIVPENGFKQRSIDYGKYIIDGKNSIEDGNTLEAFRRESSVYLHTNGNFKFPHEYDSKIPIDTSRYNISSYKGIGANEFNNDFNLTNSLIIPDDFIKNFAPNTTLSTYQGYVSDYLELPITGGLIYPQDIYQISGTPYLVEIVTAIDTTGLHRVFYTFVDPSSVDISTIPSAANFVLISKSDPSNDSAPVFTTTSFAESLDDISNQIRTNNILEDVREKLQGFVINGVGYESSDEIGTLALQIYYSYQSVYYNQKYPAINPETIREANISSYYGSIKAYLPTQWGRMYSYNTIDTGFYSPLYDENNNQLLSVPTIFGGDTFINKFALKIKLPFFKYNTVDKSDQTDIAYDEIGTINFPMFWISTKPVKNNLDINSYIDNILEELPNGGPKGGFLSALWNIVKNLFTGGAASSIKILSQMASIIKEIGIFADQNINLDEQSENGLIKTGKMYLFSYGIPYFFCESQVNVDYRQATNDQEGNFYPRVSSSIPDDWVQEINVPIINDNNYTYNQTFSKQNKENFYDHLREDFDPNKICQTQFPNRAFWSEKTDLNETRNNWLIYKPLNRFDLPKSFGELISLDGILNRQIIARFENKTQIYNALTAVNTNNPLTAYLGNSELFTSTPPLDFAETDNGSMGSQHKFFLKTEQGIVYTDSKRGQVILLRGSTPTVISDLGMSKWFNNNLPFQITKYFPEVNIDNHFEGIGITGTYDEYYQRLILTKKDFEIKNPEKLEYICNNFVDISQRDEIIKKNKQNGWHLQNQDCNKLNFTKQITITTLPKNTDIYAFFDTTSMQPSDGVAAKNALQAWFDTLKEEHTDYTGNLYVITPEAAGNDNKAERYLYYPEVIYSGQMILENNPVWTILQNLPPNFNTPNYIYPKNAICLAFVDEVFDLTNGYQSNLVSNGFSTPTQPTTTFISDFENFKNIYPSFDSFKAVLYPIVQSLTGQGGACVLQGMAAIEGTLLTPEQIAETGTTVDVSLLETENPYQGYVLPDTSTYIALNQLGWKGVYNKTSPASEVFNSETFGQELTELLDLGGEITYTQYKTEELPVVELFDPEYFRDISWTLSFSFLTNSWTSWHSYIPNYYVSFPTYFQSGNIEGLWSHNQLVNSYCNFYNEQRPYTIQYPFVYKTEDEIVQAIRDYSSALIYESKDIFYEPDEIKYFNKAVLYNRQQNSGLLNLIPKIQNNLKNYMQYPKFNLNSKDILISKTDNWINFNTFWDIVKNKSVPMFSTPQDLINTNLNLNNSNLDYSNKSFKKSTLRAKDLTVRLTLDNDNTFKLISRFIVTESQKSNL